MDAPQPDTVDVEKLIDALSITDKAWNVCMLDYLREDPATRRALAALHPRLKEEVEK